ncbi:dTDP-4-dehydrorhamnose 3,5-epimerase [Ectothiorhodospiraceae bacterium BW-2]|nr:dTDP-4-dehydrorhamnose 3,5-epimerase [Ectothiorhodospiraceae bacterium BW-2]
MEFLPTQLAEVILIKPQIFGDERGFFMETYHQQKFRDGGIEAHFVQDNHSRSVQGTLRGLHYQIAQTQGKLVRVTHGEVFDVAVDIRASSPTYGQWVGETLSAENRHQLWVPEGFAHGFYVLSERAEFTYKCTALYAPEHERAILWNDPDIGIAWPLLNGSAPLLSDKDSAAPRLTQAEIFA